jgi:hypothetical protein
MAFVIELLKHSISQISLSRTHARIQDTEISMLAYIWQDLKDAIDRERQTRNHDAQLPGCGNGPSVSGGGGEQDGPSGTPMVAPMSVVSSCGLGGGHRGNRGGGRGGGQRGRDKSGGRKYRGMKWQ